ISLPSLSLPLDLHSFPTRRSSDLSMQRMHSQKIVLCNFLFFVFFISVSCLLFMFLPPGTKPLFLYLHVPGNGQDKPHLYQEETQRGSSVTDERQRNTCIRYGIGHNTDVDEHLNPQMRDRSHDDHGAVKVRHNDRPYD